MGHTWLGFKGDGIVRRLDDHAIPELKAKIAELESKLTESRVHVEHATLKFSLWSPRDGVYCGPNVEDARDTCAAIGRELAMHKNTLAVLEDAAEQGRRRALDAERVREMERELGITPAPEPMTEDDRHAAEYAAVLAQLRANPSPDQSSKTREEIRREVDARDVFLQARLTGQSPVDAMDIAAGRVDSQRDAITPQPVSTEPVARPKVERRGLLDTILRR